MLCIILLSFDKQKSLFMELNMWIAPIAAIIPMVIGFIWYHEKVFGKAWMSAAGMTPEKIQNGNMLVTFGVSYILSCFLAITLMTMSIHQFGVFQVLAGVEGIDKEGSAIFQYFSDFMAEHGHRHRSFGHGALHGAIAAIMFAIPVLATNALFEAKGFKYILVNGGYWIVTITLMSGLVCQFG